jgi:hypothetical protein
MLVAYWATFVAGPDWVVRRIDEHLEFTALVLFEVLTEYQGWLADAETPVPPERAMTDRARLAAQYGHYCEKSWWAQDVEETSNGKWKVACSRSLAAVAPQRGQDAA